MPDSDQQAPLVGRTAEMATLRALFGDRAVVAIVGDPGIGKTRLLTELLAEARGHGRVVLSGHGSEFEREVPFGVFRNALEDHLRAWPESRWAGLDPVDRRLLPSVFPTLATDGRGQESGLVAAERYRLHRAVRALLEIVAGPAGLVLAFDDLHWGDDSSMEMLDHLLRHPPRAPVVLALAYRSRQAPERLHQAFARATRQGWGTTVDVGPLSVAEAGALLPAHLSPARQEELYRASGGNPFYLEVPAACGTVTGPPNGPMNGPAGDTTRDPAMLASVAEPPEPEVHTALDELSRRDLIRAGETPGAFRFRHPFLRSAAYHTVACRGRGGCRRRPGRGRMGGTGRSPALGRRPAPASGIHPPGAGARLAAPRSRGGGDPCGAGGTVVRPGR